MCIRVWSTYAVDARESVYVRHPLAADEAKVDLRWCVRAAGAQDGEGTIEPATCRLLSSLRHYFENEGGKGLAMSAMQVVEWLHDGFALTCWIPFEGVRGSLIGEGEHKCQGTTTPDFS